MHKNSRLQRYFRHLAFPRWRVKQYFPERSLQRLEAFIAQFEKYHTGQIRFVIESGWSFLPIYNRKSTRTRALEWFGLSEAWNTEDNIGILIYVSFADREIEIIADRAINRVVSHEKWDEINQEITRYFVTQDYILGLENGLYMINHLLVEKFPLKTEQVKENEVPDDIILH